MFRHFITRAALVCAAVFAGHALAATDVNQASRAELESVKGIGPGLAGKILQAREASTFKDWGDLVDRVVGVGPGNAARFSQAGLTVAGSAYAHQPAGAQLKPASKSERVSKDMGPGKSDGKRDGKSDGKSNGKSSDKNKRKAAALPAV